MWIVYAKIISVKRATINFESNMVIIDQYINDYVYCKEFFLRMRTLYEQHPMICILL